MARPRRLDHVKYVRAHGRLYAYFNTGRKNERGKAIYHRLPDPSSPQFFVTYGQLKASRERREAPQYTVRALVDEYLKSSAFTDKADATQKLYRLQLRKARSAAHAAFDPLWKRGAMNRPDAYKWLAGELGIDPAECHIGMMTEQQARQVVEVVEAAKSEAA